MADYQLFKADPNVWESVAMGYDWINLNPATNTFVAQKRATTAEERTLLTNLGLAVLDSVAIALILRKCAVTTGSRKPCVPV